MKSITARQVFRRFSGINALCNTLSVRHGIKIGAEKSENPENSRDNALIISFEFTDGNEIEIPTDGSNYTIIIE